MTCLNLYVNRKPTYWKEPVTTNPHISNRTNIFTWWPCVCDNIIILQNRKTFVLQITLMIWEIANQMNREYGCVKHKSTFILGSRTPIHFGSRSIFWNRNSNLVQHVKRNEFEFKSFCAKQLTKDRRIDDQAFMVCLCGRVPPFLFWIWILTWFYILIKQIIYQTNVKYNL